MTTMQLRKKSRDSVYKLIYEYLFSGEVNDKTLSLMLAGDMPMSEIDYINTVYHGVIDNIDSLKATVKEYARAFDIDRIYKLDLAALLLAIYEMKYMDDIPMGTSICEAVELVKLYSTEKSNVFVNGVLSSVYKELTANNDR